LRRNSLGVRGHIGGCKWPRRAACPRILTDRERRRGDQLVSTAHEDTYTLLDMAISVFGWLRLAAVLRCQPMCCTGQAIHSGCARARKLGVIPLWTSRGMRKKRYGVSFTNASFALWNNFLFCERALRQWKLRVDRRGRSGENVVGDAAQQHPLCCGWGPVAGRSPERSIQPRTWPSTERIAYALALHHW